MEKNKKKGATPKPVVEKQEDDEVIQQANQQAEKEEGDQQANVAQAVAKKPEVGDSDDSEESDDEDDDLMLEGVLVRNPEVDSSSDDSSDEEESEAKKRKAAAPPQNSKDSKPKDKKKRQKKKKSNEPDVIDVEFTFNDMDEKFFHGLKNLIHASCSIYQPHSSPMSDLMIDNISVGTVCSTEGDLDGNVYGFASVLNVKTYGKEECIKFLKAFCLKHCPKAHRKEMETVLSGTTNRPAGFLLHGRMVNVPLEIVHILHQQLILDLDWAVENAEGGPEEQKSLDFGAFVRLAPCSPEGKDVYYKFFDDEIFATNAEFVYNVDLHTSSEGVKELCSVIVMTKTGHRAAMKDIQRLVHGN